MHASARLDAERPQTADVFQLGPVGMPYLRRQAAIDAIARSLVDGTQTRVAFCNANTMLLALRDEAYARALADFLVLNDGVGIDIASRLVNGRAFDDNLNGTDFVPAFLAVCPTPLSIYLLGARPDVVAKAAGRFAATHPRHRIVGARDGYFRPDEAEAVIAGINAAAPDLLLVAMGNPLQELFIHEHGPRLKPRIVMGVGALFDFMAGSAPRAPGWIRSLRLEWLFRLANEPVRLGRRYTIDLAAFLAKVLVLRFARHDQLASVPRSRPRSGA